jgi:16S rRNA (guanine527-N7)-methyltransferase
MLDAPRIAALLEPFLGGADLPAELVAQLQAYLDLLLRWNARINLTAVRDPEQIVTRHFGESLFAARILQNAGAFAPRSAGPPSLTDVGSGAGFPGLPIKLLAPEVSVTLIESQNKKVTFLREAIRTLGLKEAEVYCGRAETWNRTATVVTLRAVERFAKVLPAAADLVAPGGRLCLLIGDSQLSVAQHTLGSSWEFSDAHPIPLSEGRIAVVVRRST